jgi:molybdenum cofactor cytidylyltransferase
MASVAIVPAAGRGERFGGMKLAAMLRGEPLLGHTLRCLLDGGVEEVILVTGGTELSGVALAADPRVRRVSNPDPARGMFSSIQTGVAEASGDPILILPGDMPFVSADTVSLVLDAARRTGGIVSPRFEGRRGHPIAVPDRLRAQILAAEPRTTLASILDQHEADRHLVDVTDPGVLRDVDVVADLWPGKDKPSS